MTDKKTILVYELEFMGLGEYSVKAQYLKHITELINVKLTEGQTYLDLFEKLKALFPADEAKQKTVKEWIQHQYDSLEDHAQFKTALVNSGEAYAAFNLMVIK